MPLGPRIRGSRKKTRSCLLSHSETAFHKTSRRQQLVRSYLFLVSIGIVLIADKVGLKKAIFGNEKIGKREN